MEKIKVLYIDDEIGNLNAFKASFRRVFDIQTANSADDGLTILEEFPIEIIIADQKMPGKTGVDFFESIAKTYPNPIRILLTGYSDIEDIIAAINKGKIYQYIAKPWNEHDLKLTIENAFKLYKLEEQNNNLNLKYKKVFSDSTDPIVLIDAENKIIDSNKSATTMLTSEDNHFTAVDFSQIFNNKTEAEEVINTIKEKNVIKDYESILLNTDGKKIVSLISGNAITNSHNEVINYQFILKDITKRTELNQLLLKKVVETQETERERISRDLHDGLGQSMAAIKLHLEHLKSISDQDVKEPIDSILSILQNATADLRRICHNTLPIVLKEYGLIKAIKELEINSSTPDFNVIFNSDHDFQELPQPLEISIFRIIQEFINNSIKHSGATEIKIDIRNVQENIVLNLKDNGIGFNINDLEIFKGHGLKNIQNRIDSFKGEIKINSEINIGTEFDINFPNQLYALN